MKQTLSSTIAAVVISLLVGCGGLKVSRPLQSQPTDWPTFGGDKTRANTSGEVLFPPLEVEWVHDISAGVGNGSPVVVDSALFLGNLRGELFGINAHTGRRIGWISLGEAIAGAPVIDGNTAIVALANTSESLVAYDLISGRSIWSQRYGDIEASPLLKNKLIYFGNTEGYFYCVDREKGAMQWQYRVGNTKKRKGIRTTAAAESGIVVFGADDGVVYALDAGSGSVRWTFETGGSIFSNAAISNGTVLAATIDGRLVALSLDNGTERWSYALGATVFAGPAVSDGIVVIGTTGGTVAGLDLAHGSLRWSTTLGEVVNSNALISGSTVYVGTLKKELYALDIHTGRKLWETTVSGRIKTSPVIARGRLFVTTDDRKVFAFRETSR